MKVALDIRPTWSIYIDGVRNKVAQLESVGNSRQQEEWYLHQKRRSGISSSSVLRWTTRSPSGRPPPAPVSGKFRCFKPSVFAMLPVHLGTLMTVKFTRVWEVPFFVDHVRSLTGRFDSKLADVGNPLVTQIDRYLCWPIFDPGLIKRPKGDRARQTCPCHLSKGGHVDKLKRAHLALPCLMLFSLSWKANGGGTRKDRARPASFIGTTTSPVCLIFADSSKLHMANLGSNAREPSNQSYTPH